MANKCIAELNGHELEGRKVFARHDQGDTSGDNFKDTKDDADTRGKSSSIRGSKRGGAK